MPQRIISCSAIIALLASVAVGALSMPSGAMAFGQHGGGGGGAATSEAVEATLEVVAWGEAISVALAEVGATSAEAILVALVEAILVGATSAEAISAALAEVTSAEAILAASAEAILAGRRD